MSLFEDILIGIGSFISKEATNDFLINRLVHRGRTRPHPWSTRCSHICWSGLTDRTYSGRLLPPKPYVGPEALGTARPPIDEVTPLFAAAASGQRPCPKSTCLFPAFAQYLTDGFIRTLLVNDPPFGDGTKEDRQRTTSNHEIDLSPLYGRNWQQTQVLRDLTRKGRLKSQTIGGEEYSPFLYDPDDPKLETVKAEFCVAGKPVLDQPLGAKNAPNRANLFAVGGDRVNAAPQIAMINTLLLREHNRLAAMLEAAEPGWNNEAVFQTARNILIVMFIKVVVQEYINHINTTKFKIMARPNVAWEADWNRPNWITAEFSLLYRWHSLVPSTMTWGGQAMPLLSLLLNNDPLTSGGLAAAFADVSANNATALGLGNSDPIFVTVATMAEPRAVKQGRENDMASYNDYRRAMGMKAAKSFEDIVGKSDDPVEKARRGALAARLQALYGNVENLEYYVGIFAEPRDENGPLPSLIASMVAMDAFSQAFTNPLLSKHIWDNPENREATFTKDGWDEIKSTNTLRDMVSRNTPNLGDRFVGMTRQDWRRE